MNTVSKNTLLLSLAALPLSQAGEIDSTLAVSSDTNSQPWYELIGDYAHVYKNDDNPFVQSIKFDGRAHYQYGFTDINNDIGADFDGDGHELRRLRLGTKINFLGNWHLRYIANLEDGGFNDDVVGFNSTDETYIQYHFGDVGGIENLKLSYGRHKFDIGIEVHQSSNKIRTIERTNISNTLYRGGRPTGLLAFGTYRTVDFTLGFLSSDRDDILGEWKGDHAYYMSLEKDALGGHFVADFVWNDGDANSSDDVWAYQWAASLGYQTEVNDWNIIADFLAGEGFDGSSAYGFYLINSKFVVGKKLELVTRYQYAAGNGDFLLANSRNERNVAPSGTFGELDENHSFYLGLNYYFLDNHAKFLAAIDYENFSGPNTNLDGYTLWGALRFYF